MSTEVKHTPGPWEVQQEDIDELTGGYCEPSVVVRNENNGTIFVIAIVRIGLVGTEANAHLIAAAPDLLKALKVAKNTVECASIDLRTGDELPWYKMAKRAIQKAEGGK